MMQGISANGCALVSFFLVVLLANAKSKFKIKLGIMKYFEGKLNFFEGGMCMV